MQGIVIITAGSSQHSNILIISSIIIEFVYQACAQNYGGRDKKNRAA
jgi:hypothetical protein